MYSRSYSIRSLDVPDEMFFSTSRCTLPVSSHTRQSGESLGCAIDYKVERTANSQIMLRF